MINKGFTQFNFYILHSIKLDLFYKEQMVRKNGRSLRIGRVRRNTTWWKSQIGNKYENFKNCTRLLAIPVQEFYPEIKIS